MGLILIMGYEYGLNKLGLNNYIMNSERNGIIGMNKEGIFSLIGKLFKSFKSRD